MTNPHRGEVAVQIDGKDYTFVVNLQAMAEIEDALGVSFPEMAAKMSKGVSIKSLLVCAQAFAKAGGCDDVSEIGKSQDVMAIAKAVGDAISATAPKKDAAKN